MYPILNAPNADGFRVLPTTEAPLSANNKAYSLPNPAKEKVLFIFMTEAWVYNLNE